MITEMVLVQKAVSKVFGDFVSKVVSDGVDVLKSAIKDADLDRKSYNQNLQTRLYQLIVDALNRFTYNKYEKQDKLYDAAESIIKGYISSKGDTDVIKSGLKMLVSGVDNDTCQEFLETLCGEICGDDNSDLYKEIDMLWKRQESEYFRGEFAKIGQKGREMLEQLNDLKEVLDFIKGNMSNRENHQMEKYNKIPIVNRADEYAKRWNENVFLNNFNEEDESAGINIKLREIYEKECLPHYIWKNNTKSSDKLRDLLTKYIINNDNRKMLLILGQPGIGKSTLITWIMANLVEKKDDILVYQFANDLGSINWQGENVLNDIFRTIGLGYDDLENKTLILDGFDEIYVGGARERILNKLDQELIRRNILKKFSLIITCRENYIYDLQNIGCNYIILQEWNQTQIDIFCRVYWETCEKKISEEKIQKILEHEEIFGIPLILYMILALDITIEKSSSIVDVYDQIFSLKKGGIYDRCYDVEHRINEPETKKHVHRISQRIAFWIFENNADEAFISKDKFEVICENEVNELGRDEEEIQSDTLIGNFFKLKHCEGEGADELQFVHRSIYEYFVAVYFFESIRMLTSKEKVAGKLGELLKRGRLSKQILEYIKYKFDSMQEYNLPDITKKVCNIMLKDGMTYHTNIVLNDGATYHIKEEYRNMVNREINIFTNMLEVVGLWNSELGNVDDNITTYLQCNRENGLNLKGLKLNIKNFEMEDVSLNSAYLYGANLREADLGKIDLSGADLRRADLTEANLSGANLGGADLSYSNLSKANLSRVNLRRANLSEASLDEADMSVADLRGADLSYSNLMGTDLRETNLRRADLRETNLKGADLRETNLRETELKGADLRGADLRGAKLNGVDLSDADLDGVDLNDVDLYRTIFNEEQVNVLYKKYDLSKSRVVLVKANKISSYQEYCIKKQVD